MLLSLLPNQSSTVSATKLYPTYRVELRPRMVTLKRAAEALTGGNLTFRTFVDLVLLGAADFYGGQTKAAQLPRNYFQRVVEAGTQLVLGSPFFAFLTAERQYLFDRNRWNKYKNQMLDI